MRLLYVIGFPGSGKSTLLKALVGDTERYAAPRPVPHILYFRNADNEPFAAQLGREREGFPGTDTLAMNIQPKVRAYLEQEPYDHVIAEGDRLANGSFFRDVEKVGIELTVAYLKVPDEVAEARRGDRGSKQDPVWIKGRHTKVRVLAADWARVTIDGTQPVESQVEQLCQADPTAALFRS